MPKFIRNIRMLITPSSMTDFQYTVLQVTAVYISFKIINILMFYNNNNLWMKDCDFKEAFLLWNTRDIKSAQNNDILCHSRFTVYVM